MDHELEQFTVGSDKCQASAKTEPESKKPRAEEGK